MKCKHFIIMVLNCALLLGAAMPVFGEEKIVELSLEDATKMALAHSTALISENLSAEISKEKMEDINSEDVGNYNKSQLLSYLKQAASFANSKLSQQVKEESVAFSLKKAYIEAINMENEIALEQKNLILQSKELEISRVKKERGLLSESSFQSEKLIYDKSAKQLEDKKENLAAAYRSLSILIGKSEDTKYSLSLEPTYQKLELSLTLNGYINNKLASDLNVQQQIRNVDTAATQKRLTAAIVSDDNLYSDQEASNSLTTAELTLEDTKIQLRYNLLNCYNSIITLEESIEMNQKELESLQNELTIAQTKLELKTDTQLAVDKAENAISTMENTIQEQIYEHMLLMEQFDKSYLL